MFLHVGILVVVGGRELHEADRFSVQLESFGASTAWWFRPIPADVLVVRLPAHRVADEAFQVGKLEAGGGVVLRSRHERAAADLAVQVLVQFRSVDAVRLVKVVVLVVSKVERHDRFSAQQSRKTLPPIAELHVRRTAASYKQLRYR